MGNICVIGPSGTGKTTYLAALAYCYRNNPTTTITPVGEDAEKLVDRAEDRILAGINLEPTGIDGVKISSVDDLPYYSFKIEIKKRLRQPDEMKLVVWDFPGEIFNDLAKGQISKLHQEFLEKCLIKDVVGCLMLLEGWEQKSDRFYSKLMTGFSKQMDSYQRTKDLRLAVAMSKCERGELWPGRLDPKMDIFNVHLRETTRTLESAKIPNLKFYALSTFGVLKPTDPRPNRTDEVSISAPIEEGGGCRSYLREADKWKPYNLIAPLYWLSKGKRMGAGV